jgi:hypothetical protein
MFAYEIKNVAERYELPLVAVERNNHGHTTIAKLKEIYPLRHIFSHKPDKLGFESNLVTKPQAFFRMNTAINDELVEIPSGRIQREMRIYDKENLRVIRSNDDTITNHFDVLTACVIGFSMIDHAGAIRRKKPIRQSTCARRGVGMRGT